MSVIVNLNLSRTKKRNSNTYLIQIHLTLPIKMNDLFRPLLDYINNQVADIKVRLSNFEDLVALNTSEEINFYVLVNTPGGIGKLELKFLFQNALSELIQNGLLPRDYELTQILVWQYDEDRFDIDHGTTPVCEHQSN